MWIASTLLLVIGCGAVGGLAQALIGQSRTGQIGSRSGRAVIGAVTAVIVVGLLSQSAFLEAVNRLFQPADTAEVFQALLLVASVALAAGFAGQTLLKRVADSLLKQLGMQTDQKIAAAEERSAMQTEEKIAMERRLRGTESTIIRAVTSVRDADLRFAIQLLEPVLRDPRLPESFIARAHGIIANAKKRIGILEPENKVRFLNEAVNHIDEAHRLSPDDYRYLFNRACYCWMLSEDAIDEVLRDLRHSIEKGLSFHEIEKDEDLATLRGHERFRELEATATARMGL